MLPGGKRLLLMLLLLLLLLLPRPAQRFQDFEMQPFREVEPAG